MRKAVATLLFGFALSLTLSAQILPSATPAADSAAFAKVRARMDSIRQYRPTVGLVLAGGGARGLAHLGVIKYMEELGIPVDVITGTSMGGLVGGLYALGYKHDQLDSLVRDIQWPLMMSDNIPNDYLPYKLKKYRDKFVIRIPHHYDSEDLLSRLEKEHVLEVMAEEAGNTSANVLEESMNKFGIGMPDGYLYGLNVRNMLSSVSVGYADSLSFADLPIPYACVATDLYSMAPKYWTEGNITTAMRSTMAIPFYFRAVRDHGEVLLDGGMRNNFPVDLAREMGADIVIGSEMSVPRKIEDLNTPVDFLFQTITLLSREAAGPAREMLNLGVHHELKGYNMLSFDDKSVDDIIDQGYQNALSQKEMFESIAAVFQDREEPPVSHPAPAVNLAQQKVSVGSIHFSGISDVERTIIMRTVVLPDNMEFDRAAVETILNSIYGTNAFEAVTYHLEGREAPYTLVFDCQKGQTNDLAIGLRADTDETVALALHYGLGTRRLSGPRLTTDLKLGTNPAFSVDFSHKFMRGLPTMGVAARARLMNTALGYRNGIQDMLLIGAFDAYLEDARLRFGSFRVGATAEINPYERFLEEGEYWVGWDWKSYWLSAFANFKLDTFDDGYFPTRGVRLSVDGRYVFKGYTIDLDPTYTFNEDYLTADGTVPRYGSFLAGAQVAFSLGSHFTLLPSAYFGMYMTEKCYRDPDSRRDHLNPVHRITVGGFLPNRYTERQIPFFGFPHGYKDCTPLAFVSQVDLRYQFARKNYVTARAALFKDDYCLKELLWGLGHLHNVSHYWAFGAEYARQTPIGPLKLDVQWCTNVGLSAYASIGFDF